MKRILLLLPLLLLALVAKAVPDYEVVDYRKGTLYNTYVINYLSVGPDGVTPATVSGVITVPSSSILAFSGLWMLDSHHTLSDNASVPSSEGTTAAGKALGSMAVVIAPDYYGYGLTKDKPHPYLAQTQNARNSLDLLEVALDFLPTKGQEPLMLCNVGYSQGAGVAMAALSLMENDEAYADIIPSFSGGVYSWCGDGPYSPYITGKDLYEHAEHVNFPAVLPHIVNGFLCSAPAALTEGLKFSDFFSEAMAGLEEVVAAKELSNDDLSAWMVNATGGSFKLTDFFSADMATMESVLFQKMLPWLEANDVTVGWTPKTPLYLYHLIEDDIVTFANAELAVENLGIPADRFFPKHASDVNIIIPLGTHTEFALKFFTAMSGQAFGFYRNATGIETLDAEQQVGEKLRRSLQGLPVGGSYRGIVIQDGKKFIMQ